jgi:hypothetical protein
MQTLFEKGESMPKLYKLATLLIVGLMPLSAAACQPIQPVPVEDAKVAYCDDLTAFGEAVDAVHNLPEDATVEEFETAVEAVTGAYDELQNSAWELADAQTAALEQSYDAMRESFDSISSGTTLGDARAIITEGVDSYKAAYEQVREVSCGTT